MSTKTDNPSKKRIRLLILILLSFSIWAGFTAFNQWLDIKEAKKELAQLAIEENKILSIKKELNEKVLLLQNPDYIAEIARKYYFLSKPGEIIFISPEN